MTQRFGGCKVWVNRDDVQNYKRCKERNDKICSSVFPLLILIFCFPHLSFTVSLCCPPLCLFFSLCISSTFSASHFHRFLLFVYLLALDLHSPPSSHLFSLAASLSLSIFPPLSPPFVLLDLSFFFCSQSEVIILFISASNTTFFLFYLVKWMIKGS